MDRDIKNKRKEGNKSDRDGLKIEIGEKRKKIGWVDKIKLFYPSCLVLIQGIPMSLILVTVCWEIAVLN